MGHFWESEKIFFNGDDYFQQLIQDIDEAESYITVEMYIFNDDILGKKIAGHLINAHCRGVKVEVIVDGVGSFNFYEKLLPVFKKQKIKVKTYNPLPFLHPYSGQNDFFRRFNVLLVRFGRLNRRNHRKIITIDENILYTGSFNITSEHTRYHYDDAWFDMGVRVTGPRVAYGVLFFKRMWKLRDYFRYKKIAKKRLGGFDWKSSPLIVHINPRMRLYFHQEAKKRIAHAKERIWLMTPYFIPTRNLIRSLGKAAKRNVDVRLLISQKTDVKFFQWLQFFYYQYLLKKGVRVFQYKDAILHAKNYIVDDYMTIGSTNLNHRSVHHDLEVDLVILEDENKKNILKHFEELTQSQLEITAEGLKKRPLWDRILSRVFFLFKYWF